MNRPARARGLRRLSGPLAATLSAALAFIACGSPLVGAVCEQTSCDGECKVNADCKVGYQCRDGSCVPKPECAQNADCDDASVCIGGVCKPAGECLSDAHCPCEKGFCKAGGCVAPAKDCTPSPPIPCKLNRDCPAKMYCVADLCVSSTECLTHKDCPAGEACFGSNCYAL